MSAVAQGARTVQVGTDICRLDDTRSVIHTTVAQLVMPVAKMGIDAGTFVLLHHAPASQSQRRGARLDREEGRIRQPRDIRGRAG